MVINGVEPLEFFINSLFDHIPENKVEYDIANYNNAYGKARVDLPNVKMNIHKNDRDHSNN